MGFSMLMASMMFMLVVLLFGPMFLALSRMICCPKNQYMNDEVENPDVSYYYKEDIPTQGNNNFESPTSSSAINETTHLLESSKGSYF